MSSYFDLSGRIALVTGASRGIGEAVAIALAAQGAHVIVCSRRIDGCMRVCEKIISSGGSAEPLACNVGDLDAVADAVAKIEDCHGRLDILVNNAAANPYYGPILETGPDVFEKTVDVNIRGFFFMSVAAGKLMKANGGGVIINTASVNALSPGHHQGIYSISKAAIVSMTKAFAKECGAFNIRVNALLPGLTQTKFASALFADEEVLDGILEAIPLGRAAQPSDQVGAVLYLASDAASFTTGACLVVDGGQTA
tara:strand:- start:15701 stop:16462 length:762 start_codon:yes stop_codon:yes gene_type:complete